MHRTRMLIAVVALAAAALLWTTAALASSDDFIATASPTAAPPAVTEPAPSPTATPALTLTSTSAMLTAGDPATLTVRLGIAGATVQLSRQVAGASGFDAIGPLVTDSRGVATYRVHPRVTTTYRVEYAGDDVLWLPASADVTVSVRPRVSFSATARVYRGGRVRLGATVRPAHPGAAVAVQLWQDGAWTGWKSLVLGSDSRVTATWRPDQVGAQRMRVVMEADVEHAAGASRVRRVQVVKPNPYAVPINTKGIIVVDISRYRLHFFSYGRELRSFPCVTGRPSLPTPLGHFKIYARGMWPGGPYGARIMSYHPPCAIHGTNEPWLLKRFPRNFSHGCTRLANANVIWLYGHAPLGTPVWNVR